MNSSDLKLVIFDWDGTVMDSVAKIVDAMQMAAKREGLPVPSDAQVKDIIGLSLLPALSQLFGELNQQQIDDMAQFYKEAYLALDKKPSPLFDGITEVFESLAKRDIKITVATGKSRVGLNRLIEQTGLGHYFCDSMTADEAESKPHPQMIDDILTRQGVDKSQVFMVGDSTLDLIMAKNANVKALGVSYGAHDKSRLLAVNPVAVVDDAKSLLDYLS
ncbi:MAG: HAD-IA family hydrolase [Psychrobium sp.]